MVVMLSLREWFSKRVRNIPVSINLLNDHILALQNLMDQVKFFEYVLGAMMCPRFLGLCYCASIVAIHDHGFRDTRDYTKFGHKFLDPYRLLCRFGSSNILRFSCRVHNRGFFGTLPYD